ncbi:collagen-like triple helix repeat-containing protein [Rheinheimera sp. UJ63]|uniref:collagen-like triple helix repeat-containing protein n=1 Tax=Rheinheimera sp. UJ63 TaxID=2910157 RepID=UPI001F2E93D1|nr:collagen-like protein [Rheinheimera sp. UJ63]MCF4007897.1 collagen-like protein [Rheinheimera sp. UJ63]
MTTSKLVRPTGPLALSALALAMLLALSGCNGDDGAPGEMGATGQPGQPGPIGNNGQPGFAAANFLIANNGTDNRNTVDVVNQNAAMLKRLTGLNNEGLALDPLGNLVQAGDSMNGSLKTFCQIAQRADGAAFNLNRDREITGATTGLVNPKGIAYSQMRGLVFIADQTAMQVTVYGGAAAGNVAPLATTTTDAMPWDLFYDDNNDRLYVALTNGVLSVYDNYVASNYAAMPTRNITPVDSNGAKQSINLHGIAYDRLSDKMVLSDVGSASDATDGAIFVLNNISMVDGNVVPSRVIKGPATKLGNPVDIILSGSELRIAEKANDAILVYANIFAGASGDIAPDLTTSAIKPEALVELTASRQDADISDISSAAVLLGVAVSSNPAVTGPTTGQISRLNAPLTSNLGQYNALQNIESVTFDLAGDSYTTFDTATSGGIVISNRVATMRLGEQYSAAQDRIITGSNTGLISPKGLDVDSASGLIFVAENNATTPGVFIYSACASGNAAPLLTLNTAPAQPWDVDYDPTTDRAFVALTNGSVAVFNQVRAKWLAGSSVISTADRMITPAVSGVAVAAPTNLHGIDYDFASDALIVSDVGSAADATDGKIYIINNASSAEGLTNIAVNISGANTLLGNPVDIMYSGEHLYVAEKSNNRVLRFDNILNSAGGNIAANASFAVTAPESVAIIPVYLSNRQ